MKYETRRYILIAVIILVTALIVAIELYIFNRYGIAL